MSKKTFHITNGGVLTEYLTKLNFEGKLMTWHEMLCVGPTTKEIDNDNFFNLRKEFIESTYNIPYKEEVFRKELDKLSKLEDYEKSHKGISSCSSLSCLERFPLSLKLHARQTRAHTHRRNTHMTCAPILSYIPFLHKMGSRIQEIMRLVSL